jgi:hypothetical protein
MPLASLSTASNIESVAVVCGPNGCVRTAPAYRRYGYGYRGYGARRYGYVHRGYVHRGYGHHRGYRRR